MRTLLILTLMTAGLSVITGCSRFSGEWVQDGSIARDGSFKPIETDNRLALKFTPPSTVRVGRYLVPAGVVDQDSTTFDTYVAMKHRTVAQVAGMALKVENGHLVGFVSGENTLRFSKMKGASIFPPSAVIPSIVDANDAPRAPDNDIVTTEYLPDAHAASAALENATRQDSPNDAVALSVGSGG